MPTTTLYRRFHAPMLIAAASILVTCRPSMPPRALDPPQDAGYAEWLEKRSMLHAADRPANELEGDGAQWRPSFGTPQPQALVKAHSVWLLHYPGSVITEPGKSVIATWGDPALWDVLADIGIDMLHTCPTKQAGGIVGQKYTPTIDGWFDRIALRVDSQLGTDNEYREMVRVAKARGAGIAGDMVPLHTGFGPDFRLAELGYKDYDGAYDIVEIERKDWPLLPEVADTWSTALVSKAGGGSGVGWTWTVPSI